MEDIQGQTLATAWRSYSNVEKEEVVHRVAEIVLDLAEARFSGM